MKMSTPIERYQKQSKKFRNEHNQTSKGPNGAKKRSKADDSKWTGSTISESEAWRLIPSTDTNELVTKTQTERYPKQNMNFSNECEQITEKTSQSERKSVHKIINPPTTGQTPESENQGDSFRMQTTTNRNGWNNIVRMRTSIERYLNQDSNFRDKHDQTIEKTNQSEHRSVQRTTTPLTQTRLPTPENQEDSFKMQPTTKRNGQNFVMKMKSPTKYYPKRNMNFRD